MNRAKLIEELLAATNFDKYVKRKAEAAGTSTMMMVGASKKEAEAVQDAEAVDEVRRNSDKIAFTEMMISDLTNEELAQFLALYKSETGQKYIAVKAAVGDKLVKDLQEYAVKAGSAYIAAEFRILGGVLIGLIKSLKPDWSDEQIKQQVLEVSKDLFPALIQKAKLGFLALDESVPGKLANNGENGAASTGANMADSVAVQSE